MKVQKYLKSTNDDTIKELNKRAVANKEDVSLKNLIYLLQYNSLLASQVYVGKQVDFEKIYSLIRIGVGVDEDEDEEEEEGEVEENSDSEELEGKSSSIDYENLETMD